MDLRIAWRALGGRIIRPYAAGLIPLGATALFLANNPLPAHLASGAARFGGVVTVAIFLAGLAERLAVQRPVWPWARSLPRSSAERVCRDAAFLALHALPLVAGLSAVAAAAALAAVLVLPFLALRAAGMVRVVGERRSGAGGFVIEGSFAAALAALFPWSLLAAPAAAVAAFYAARESERRQKVTRWLEMRHAAEGDPLAVGEQ